MVQLITSLGASLVTQPNIIPKCIIGILLNVAQGKGLDIGLGAGSTHISTYATKHPLRCNAGNTIVHTFEGGYSPPH